MAEPALPETDIDAAGLAVRLRAVTKTYDTGVTALGPLDLDVAKGEFVSLLGPSGKRRTLVVRGVIAPPRFDSLLGHVVVSQAEFDATFPQPAGTAWRCASSRHGSSANRRRVWTMAPGRSPCWFM